MARLFLRRQLEVDAEVRGEAVSDRNNPEFYARRERQARELAERADNPEVRLIHLKMADEYAARTAAQPGERLRLSLVHG